MKACFLILQLLCWYLWKTKKYKRHQGHLTLILREEIARSNIMFQSVDFHLSKDVVFWGFEVWSSGILCLGIHLTQEICLQKWISMRVLEAKNSMIKWILQRPKNTNYFKVLLILCSSKMSQTCSKIYSNYFKLSYYVLTFGLRLNFRRKLSWKRQT